MTDDEIRNKYKDVPTSKLIMRVFVLVGKLIFYFIKHLFVQMLKGIVWCIDKSIDLVNDFIVFWNSGSTQDKIKRFKANTKANFNALVKGCTIVCQFICKYTVIGAKFLWKYLCIGVKLFVKYLIATVIGIWHLILWAVITIKDLIIHSKPTFIRLGKQIKKGSIDFWHWLKRVHRGNKLRRIRRKRAWQHFRRTKGFKGLLIEIANNITHGIKSFMEEEQSDLHDDAITEDDIIAKEIEERQGKATKISGKIFQGVKKIVEEK